MRIRQYQIDNSIWLLALPVLRGSLPWLQVRLHASIPVVFVGLWIVLNLNKPNVLPPRNIRFLKRNFCLIFFSVCWYAFSPFIYTLLGYGGGYAKGIYQIFAIVLIQVSIAVSVLILFAKGKINEIKFLLFVFMLGLFITGVKSFILGDAMSEVGGARAIMGAQHYDIKDGVVDVATEALSSGLGTYGYCYMAALISGALFLLLIKKKGLLWKATAFLEIAAAYFTIRSSGLGTPAFVFVVSISLACLSLIIKRKAIVVSAGVLLGAMLLVFAYNPRVFSFAEHSFRALSVVFRDVNQLSYRFDSIADALSGGYKSYAWRRYQLQKDSFLTFLQPRYFLLGAGEYYFELAYTNDRAIGNHSMICDRLAREGIIGFIPYIMFFLFYCKYFKENIVLSRSKTAQNVIWVFSGTYFFAAVSNPIDLIYPVLHLALPAVAVVLAEDDQSIGLLNKGV